MPDFVRQALLKNKIMDAYLARPPYQQIEEFFKIKEAESMSF
jgi:hypothetical protein